MALDYTSPTTTPSLQLQHRYSTAPRACSLPSEKVMPLGCPCGSGGVRGLVNMSWLRSAYSSRSFMASSRSSLDKAAPQVSAELYITLASWKALRIKMAPFCLAGPTRPSNPYPNRPETWLSSCLLVSGSGVCYLTSSPCRF